MRQLSPSQLKMAKHKPWRFEPELLARNCTWCANAAAWRGSIHETKLHSRTGVPHLFIDEAALSGASHAVLEMEAPRTKLRTTFRMKGMPDSESALRTRQHLKVSFGFPGTVLYEDGVFRMWADQSFLSVFESRDGLEFREVETHLGWDWQIGTRSCGGIWHFAQTFSLAARDDSAPEDHRYVAGFHCGPCYSHNPDPRFPPERWEARDVPQQIWLEAPLIKGVRLPHWESTCLAHSRDGLTWHRYSLGHEAAKGPEVLRMMSDTTNAIWRDRVRGVHRLTNRWVAAIAEGDAGTPKPNLNWWREVRGVRISSNANLYTKPKAWKEDVRWAFDSTPTEHLKRQVYSLNVAPSEADESLFIGLLNVLEWGKVANAASEPPYTRDVLRTYLATSRDGVHFDTGWADIGEPIVPNGVCREPDEVGKCATLHELKTHVMNAGTEGEYVHLATQPTCSLLS